MWRYDPWHITKEIRQLSFFSAVSTPPQPGQRKFHKKVNATKPKKRKR